MITFITWTWTTLHNPQSDPKKIIKPQMTQMFKSQSKTMLDRRNWHVSLCHVQIDVSPMRLGSSLLAKAGSDDTTNWADYSWLRQFNCFGMEMRFFLSSTLSARRRTHKDFRRIWLTEGAIARTNPPFPQGQFMAIWFV